MYRHYNSTEVSIRITSIADTRRFYNDLTPTATCAIYQRVFQISRVESVYTERSFLSKNWLRQLLPGNEITRRAKLTKAQ